MEAGSVRRSRAHPSARLGSAAGAPRRWAAGQGQTRAAGRSCFPALGTDASWPCPPSCPSAPQPLSPGQASRRASPAGFVSQDAMSFLDEPSSSGNVPGCGRGDSCVPKIQPRSCLPEPTSTVAEAKLAGGPRPQPLQGHAFDRASICPAGLSARSSLVSSPQLKTMVPVTPLLPQPTSFKAFIGA